MSDRVRSGPPDVRVLADPLAIAQAAAQEIVACARSAIAERGRFTLVLSGGSTPRRLYSLLAEDDSREDGLPWDAVHLFWGDERHVPPDHPDSNYRMVRDTLLDRAPIPPANVHRVRAELADARSAAGDYDKRLAALFGLRPREFPRFDLVLLGLGTDMHTASLFPGTAALAVRDRRVVANWVPRLREHRITLTLPVFNHAERILFLVSGADKSRALEQILRGEPDPVAKPAQSVRPENGSLSWLVDEAAAQAI